MTHAGVIAAGNIDLFNRPVVRNSDGSISTVRSITVTDDSGVATLLPTVINGVVVCDEDAIAHWRTTGEHLGVFENETAADEYAYLIHEQQEVIHAGVIRVDLNLRLRVNARVTQAVI